jgi:hypothetical protein
MNLQDARLPEFSFWRVFLGPTIFHSVAVIAHLREPGARTPSEPSR